MFLKQYDLDYGSVGKNLLAETLDGSNPHILVIGDSPCRSTNCWRETILRKTLNRIPYTVNATVVNTVIQVTLFQKKSPTFFKEQCSGIPFVGPMISQNEKMIWE